eukprot:6287536-Prorocentrum_lima.AAC.1
MRPHGGKADELLSTALALPAAADQVAGEFYVGGERPLFLPVGAVGNDVGPRWYHVRAALKLC